MPDPRPRPTPHVAVLLALLACACSAPHERLDARDVLARRDAAVRTVVERAAQEEHEFEATDGLTLAELELASLVRSRHVRRARANAAGALARARAAGVMPDPVLSLELMRLDFPATDPWFVAGALEFALPFFSARRFERAAADASHRAALAELADAERDALVEARTWWVAAWRTERATVVVRSHASALEDLARIVDGLAGAGEATPTDATALWAAARRERLRALALERDLRHAEAAIAGELDWPAPVDLALPLELPDELEGDAEPATLATDPDLVAATARLARAEEQLAAASRGALANATFGPTAEWEDGDSRYGAALGLKLPLFGGRAAVRRVAEAERDRAALELELAAAEVDAARAAARLDLAAARRELASVETEWVPLVEGLMRDRRALFDAGEADAQGLADALALLFEARLARIDAKARAARAAVRLELLGTTDLEEHDAHDGSTGGTTE